MNNVIIYGPRGCGKTTNGERFRQYYRMREVVEEAEFVRRMESTETLVFSGHVILLRGQPQISFADKEQWEVFGRVVDFNTAMKESAGE